MSSLVLSDVAYAFPDDTPLFDGLDLNLGPGLTSLVGRNGAGKSTLLRLIAGELRPTRGSISVGGEPALPPTVAYLPQLLADAPAERTLADELGVGGKLAALARIEAGEGDDDDFARLADDWSIAERTGALLAELGLPTDLGRSVLALSGGERTLGALAGRLLGQPRVLLLDEPTNNLDSRARARLFASIDRFVAGGQRIALVVSHDLGLLERAGTTVEMRAGRCRVFGGPYSHYREVIESEQAAALQSLTGARNDLRAQKRDKVEAQVVLARRERYGRKMEANKREPKVVMGMRKRQAQESAARYRATHAKGVEQAQERMREADAAVRREELLRVDLPDPGLPAGRVVLDADDPVAGRIHLVGPARVRLAGPNGSGKTTLLRRLFGEGVAGPRSRGAGRGGDDDEVVHVPWALLPQDLRVEHPEWSVVDAIRAVRPEAPAEEAHAHAARLLFLGDAGFRRLGDLSGGERLRAALAARLFARPVPQLLILDEPTNNLDLEGVQVLADALSGWRGALLLVSHDDGFCDRVGVDDVITPR
ncbi:ABC-F family ATP-binding cassette domain-containing protein [Dietzia sp. E1]|uniref:ATP-binding cassette domain-containing protein n=1 Tax=Dietzia sp. E1 TaxID=328361 RepID=UPI0015FD71B2|nr:ATP-binding cassette domain-containing protein [Dietzia sp. E1]MBB1020844.1 ABC-F family ATP-binding cassette domain-containing protein [Dietzia sp. E1]